MVTFGLGFVCLPTYCLSCEASGAEAPTGPAIGPCDLQFCPQTDRQTHSLGIPALRKCWRDGQSCNGTGIVCIPWGSGRCWLCTGSFDRHASGDSDSWGCFCIGLAAL
jgi:hypothetical protein